MGEYESSHVDEVEDGCLMIIFFFSVPSRPPVNVTTTPLNSTSFLVAWQPLPLQYANGIIIGYVVTLENMADGLQLLIETVNVNQTEVTLNRPEGVSRFCAKVQAFTKKGRGKSSSCIEAWSWSKGMTCS